MQFGYGRGFGFRGASPPWPYIGRGRGGLPRCRYPGLWETHPYGITTPYWPRQTREEELGYPKNQSDLMKSQLDSIERRIQELEKKE